MDQKGMPNHDKQEIESSLKIKDKRQSAAQDLVIEVLEKGLLDLRRAGILALLLSDGGTTPPRVDCGCRTVCGCKDVCSPQGLDPGEESQP
jgi:hypothetical protein